MHSQNEECANKKITENMHENVKDKTVEKVIEISCYQKCKAVTAQISKVSSNKLTSLIIARALRLAYLDRKIGMFEGLNCRSP